uniref:Uncharacterized protein n=1 Tax=Cacopsylla melanoneura TaxID=428564 RepID=A0A8D8QZM6_9HEMI
MFSNFVIFSSSSTPPPLYISYFFSFFLLHFLFPSSSISSPLFFFPFFTLISLNRKNKCNFSTPFRFRGDFFIVVLDFFFLSSRFSLLLATKHSIIPNRLR